MRIRTQFSRLRIVFDSGASKDFFKVSKWQKPVYEWTNQALTQEAGEQGVYLHSLVQVLARRWAFDLSGLSAMESTDVQHQVASFRPVQVRR